MKSYAIKMIMIVFVLTSCQKELDFSDTETEQTPTVVSNTKEIQNGRFVFSSIQTFEEAIEELQNKDDDKLEREFNSLYEMGFRSHSPIVKEDNDRLIETMSIEYTQRHGEYKTSSFSEEEADSDGFILDPFLASLVNNNNEIVINDTLYKFTENEGLFYAHIKDSTHLMNYFSDKIGNTGGSKTRAFNNERFEPPCMLRTKFGGHTKIDDKISRYMRPPIDRDDCDGGGNPPPPPPPPAISEEERLNNIINNLIVCNGRPVRGNWVQNIFGKSYACRDYFDKKRRIKTEFWDQNWGFINLWGF